MILNFDSWGRNPRATHSIESVEWLTDDIFPNLVKKYEGKKFLPFGKGRSYGDCCLNDNGVLLYTGRLNKFISFDSENGLLKCESGVSLSDILKFCVPRGWFLPVTPGTRHVSIGGAIANDVHGKNHHRSGTFGCHISKFMFFYRS